VATMAAARAFVREAGAGPAVVCIHASASSSAQWRPLMDRLGGHFRTLAVDLYGPFQLENLHQGGAPGIDETNPQAAGIGVRLRVDDAGDHEILERGRPVVDVFDLETDFGQRRYDLVERGIGLDMILEPGEGEFHHGPK